MFESPEDAATAAVLAMLLEVYGDPKSGNVDRSHSYPDLRYEHFLASASAVYPVFLKCARREGRLGELILEAVERSRRWHSAKNVHFGTFMLLIPLLTCWDSDDIERDVPEVLKGTDWTDSLHVLRAFRMSGARVMDVERMSLKDGKTERLLKEKEVNLYRWLEMAPKENVIAREIVSGYKISSEHSRILLSFYAMHGDLNASIVYVYHLMLSKYPDPLIIAKFGRGTAFEVMRKAKAAVEDFERTFNLERFKRLDEELISRGINPGSIADLTTAAIFLALRDGLRF